MEMGVISHPVMRKRDRRRPVAWDVAKSAYFLKWDAIKGEQIPKETLEFFIHVKEKLNQPFLDDEDKELFIQNVFSQTRGEEVVLIKNSLASQIVEQLIPDVGDEVLLEFATALDQSIGSLSEDQFASHVLQTLLLSLSCRAQAGTSAVEKELLTWVVNTADDLLARLQLLAHHQYGSHVLRTCLECLSGCQVPQLSRSRRSHEQRWRSQHAQHMKLEKHKNPPVFTEKFIEICKAVKNYEGLNDSLVDQNFSTVVQLVLIILHTLPMPKMSRKIIKRLMKLHFGGAAAAEVPTLPSVFEDESSLRVLEVALGSSEDELFGRLYSKYYRGRLCTLMQDAVLRISVQRLVEACPNADVLESVLDELDTDSAATWWTDTRLPTALALACVRLCSHQARLMKLAARVCDCELAERGPLLAACVLYRTTWPHFQSMQTRLASVQITMDGSLLLQAMLKFSKPTRLITGLLALRPDQLSAVIQSTTGCHVIDALVASPHMGDKGKSRLLESLKEELVTLACSKSGSRALDTLWSSGGSAHRAFIAETLAPHQAQLGDHFFGKFAVRNFALQLFVKKRADWLTYVKREVNKRKMFADLLPTSTAGVPGKRSKQQPQKPPEKPKQRPETRRKQHAEASPRIDASGHESLFVIDRVGVQGVLDDLE